MLIADKSFSVVWSRSCSIAQIRQDEEAMKWARSRNPHFDGKTVEDFQNDETLCQAIMLGIQNANVKATANPHKVQKFRILDQDLSIQGGELGPTLKLKRHAIKEKYDHIIDSMYH